MRERYTLDSVVNLLLRDMDALGGALTKDGIQPVIPARKGRKSLSAHDTPVSIASVISSVPCFQADPQLPRMNAPY